MSRWWRATGQFMIVRMPRGPLVLRERNFRFLFAARTISFFGTNLAPIAVAFAVLGLTGSATDVGLAFAAWTLAQISALLVGGVVADRLSRRLVMILSDTANMVFRFTMGILLVSGHATVWMLVALQALGGFAVAFYSPASTGLVPQTVPDRLLQQANGYMAIARYAVFPVGALVGGTLVATIGAGWALLLDGVTYASECVSPHADATPGAASRRDEVELLPGVARGLAGIHGAHLGVAADFVDLAVFPDHVRTVLRARALCRQAVAWRRGGVDDRRHG